MRRKHSAIGGAVPLDFVALVEVALLVDALKQIPDALDVCILERDVRVGEIDPVAHTDRKRVPQVFVAEDTLAALLVVLRDAVLLHHVPPFEAEFLLHLDLDREAVRVPTRLAVHAEALHRLIAAEKILNRPRDDVVDARLAVGRWRALVEDEVLRTLADFEALLEGLFALPAVQHRLLNGGVVEGLNLGVTGHCGLILGGARSFEDTAFARLAWRCWCEMKLHTTPS